jgi:hypothetical protein
VWGGEWRADSCRGTDGRRWRWGGRQRWGQGWGGKEEGDRHGDEGGVGDAGLGCFPLTVSLEDLRLLKLEARVEVIALNVAFFLGSGSALPLFLS